MTTQTIDWQELVAERLPVLGHRNWIVIADAAYPAHVSPGIETVATGADYETVVTGVLRMINQSAHLRPVIFLDEELNYVFEEDAPGIDGLRERLDRIFGTLPVALHLHEEIIRKLDEVGDTFRILLLKTTLTIPYTSVFIQLDCGYWSAQAEGQMRRMMQERMHV